MHKIYQSSLMFVIFSVGSIAVATAAQPAADFTAATASVALGADMLTTGFELLIYPLKIILAALKL